MSNQIREEYIILLLGSADRSVPTLWHVQKELFILSRWNPKLQDIFNFEPHFEGPYSQSLNEQVNDSAHYEKPYKIDSKIGVTLTPNGKTILKEILSKNKDNVKFTALLNALKLIRDVYDKLSKDELLFLIYVTYPKYIEFSNIYSRLVKEKETAKKLTTALLRKGLITEERYKELLENVP